MPDRINVYPPDRFEESRQWAEAFADLHHVTSLVVERAKELIPGEAVDELTTAWNASNESFRVFIERLAPTDTNQRETLRNLAKQLAEAPASTAARHDLMAKFVDLEAGELTGDPGRLKRSLLGRLKDRVLMYLYSEPRTRKKTAKAADALVEYYDVGATVAGSIPGLDKVVEIISATKQFIAIRRNRGV